MDEKWLYGEARYFILLVYRHATTKPVQQVENPGNHYYSVDPNTEYTNYGNIPTKDYRHLDSPLLNNKFWQSGVMIRSSKPKQISKLCSLSQSGV